MSAGDVDEGAELTALETIGQTVTIAAELYAAAVEGFDDPPHLREFECFADRPELWPTCDAIEQIAREDELVDSIDDAIARAFDPIDRELDL